jgi:hypothetical protein
MKNFVIRLIIISIILAIANFILVKLEPNWETPVWPLLLLFFLFSNVALFWLYSRAQQKKLSSFANYFMIATFSKLLLYLAVILIYVLYNRGDAVPFILTFFVYYIVFTTFEVFTISKQKL